MWRRTRERAGLPLCQCGHAGRQYPQRSLFLAVSALLHRERPGMRIVGRRPASLRRPLAEFTAAIYGHSDPTIRAAIDDALDGGINLSGHNHLEAELALVLCERFASIERARFTNSGTEANLMALAAAKAFTGRPQDHGVRGRLSWRRLEFFRPADRGERAA